MREILSGIIVASEVMGGVHTVIANNYYWHLNDGGGAALDSYGVDFVRCHCVT